MIFESHAHYDDPKFDNDREAMFKSFPENNIGCVVNVGASMQSSRKGIELAKKYPYVYAAVGVHPHDVVDMKDEDLEYLLHMAAYDKVVAIGEIGLDYYYDNSPKSVQKLWFREQLKLAKDLELPVIIHSREAAQDTFDLIMEAELNGSPENPVGVIHCYSGHLEMAKEYIKHGFMIGVGGILTFKNAKKLVEVVEGIPMDSILIETDAPYLAPVPHRGKRNDSRFLVHVVDEISKIKGISTMDVEDITYQNATRLFFRHK